MVVSAAAMDRLGSSLSTVRMTRTTVLGATGKTGRRVVEQLQAQRHEVRAASRTSQVRFDWTDPATWDDVVRGSEALYLVVGEARPDAVAEFLSVAASAGVRRVVLLSARGVEHAPAASPLPSAEAALRASGLNWTVLRPSWFLQNFDEGLFARQVASGELRLPTGDGRHPFVDTADIAAVAVAALTDERHAGETYELSGPAALTFAELVALLAEASGRPLRYTPLPVPQWVDEAIAAGLPTEVASMFAGLLDRIAQGHDAHLSDGVRRALDREPADALSYARRALGTAGAQPDASAGLPRR